MVARYAPNSEPLRTPTEFGASTGNMLKAPALVLALFAGAAAQAMDSPDVGVPWLYPGFAVLAFVWSGAEILSVILQRNNRSALVALSEIFSRAIPPVRLAHANNTQYAARSQGFSVGNFVAQTAWTERANPECEQELWNDH